MHLLKNTFLLLVISLLTFSSCSKDTKSPSTRSILEQGKWRITSFIDNGANETNNYTGYTFTFNSNGQVSAVKSNVTSVGSWNPGQDESQNKLTLNFAAIALNELNVTWEFTLKSYSSLALEHVNADNGGTEILVLEKIQ